MPNPSQYFKIAKTSTEEMREWMARKIEANERMKNRVVELENRINQGLRNRQAIIENLERQFKRRINHVGDKELRSYDGVGNGVLAKNEIKKDGNDVPKESNKEWKLNEKVVPRNKEVYHYEWHPIEISHLNRIIK
ncbi:hypothetical protein Tco_0593008 [Tanacetum coccineum]